MALRTNAPDSSRRFTKIGIFFDGSFFSHVSFYYKWHHPRRMRLSLPGIQRFVRRRVAEGEGLDERFCHIVDAHFFRGRLSAREAQEREALFRERIFDEALMRSGIETHYLPVSQSKEKGVDVLLALEAYERAVFKALDVCVLIAGDADFVPLVRKLHTLGTRVMVLGWNLEFDDKDGVHHETRSSHNLLEEATYAVRVHEEIDAVQPGEDPLIDEIFYDPSGGGGDLAEAEEALDDDVITLRAPRRPAADPDAERNRFKGRVIHLQDTWGFISREGDEKDFFFHETDLHGVEYEDLKVGSWVSFIASANDRGPYARQVQKAEPPEPTES
ncbi:MAG: NYN domain-containing protein [Planctomycetota bacterium]|nr:MAG: NYN domain-containing protein [Planctomycetota bacterium]